MAQRTKMKHGIRWRYELFGYAPYPLYIQALGSDALKTLTNDPAVHWVRVIHRASGLKMNVTSPGDLAYFLGTAGKELNDRIPF